MGVYLAAVTIDETSKPSHFKCELGNFFLNVNTLWADCAVQRIPINQEALFLAAAMGFQHIHRVDGVFGHSPAVHKLHSNGGIHHHVGEEFWITKGSGLRQIKSEAVYIEQLPTANYRHVSWIQTKHFKQSTAKRDTLQWFWRTWRFWPHLLNTLCPGHLSQWWGSH